ncbi:deoxynucleotidyltransferase terminal-interacting protein 1 [Neolamprologus brichardi]|uniref:deoxynucleotidyltransferase terminal-interacting protein 1 n=1 Tax=Neolamprologus brichardi TaxID=32507 RepID=UPI001643894C|nr:deoxynucleotidyltransferase terminal-interacting protein 1 [Neolamprologus brichardi]
MGAHRSDGGRDWLQQDGPEQPDHPEQSPKPWNLMIKHRQIQRRGRRSHMMVSYTDPQVSMDLLRAVLQPSFNQDIMAVFSKYQKFFEKAAENVKENVGDDIQTDHLIKEACRNVLEHAKQLFPEAEVKRAVPEAMMKRQRVADDDCSQRGSPLHKKRKMRPGPVASSDRPLTFSVVKPKSEPVKKEGPKWDPSRLSDSSTFVLGSRANKALGMGGTRGRIYIKHADLFKVRCCMMSQESDIYVHLWYTVCGLKTSLSVNRLIPVNGEPTKPDKQLQVKQEQHLKDQKFNVTFEK